MTHEQRQLRSEALEREIEATRARIDERAQELQARITPREIFDQVLEQARSSRARDYFANLGRAVTENPLPTTLTGVALGWLAYSSRHPHENGHGRESNGHAHDTLAARAGDALHEVSDRTRTAAHGVAERGRELGQQLRAGTRRVQDTWNHYLEEQPLVLGLLGLTIGAALGVSLPATETEDELVGGASDALKKKAAVKGREQLEELRPEPPARRLLRRPSDGARSGARVLGALEPVAHAGFRAEDAAAVGLELAAEMRHVDAQVLPCSAPCGPTPLQQLLLRHDPSAVRGERREQLELDRSEVHVVPVETHAARGEVDDERPALEAAGGRVGGAARNAPQRASACAPTSSSKPKGLVR
jgi:ElaB/YqjD/DUF883 family membrane-anchored ribosome-binding protein